MKKLIAMILCLVLACGMLFSCAEDDIGKDLDKYTDYKHEVIEDLTLNMYIITDNATVANAKTTVAQMISAYTIAEYHTTLNVHYMTAAEYEANINAKINVTDKTAANIVLITSPKMFYSLVSNNKLADLKPYLDSEKYGKLNVQIAEALLDISNVNGRYYAIPNNRVVGEYEYLVINKQVATQVLKFAPSTLESYKSLEDAADLIEKIDDYYGELSHIQYVYTVSGLYEKKAELEELGNICNVINYPRATVDMAFSSAFAVVNRDDKHNERAMQMIYEINSDEYLRNLLQYGVKGTNYRIDDTTGEVVRIKDAENFYSMNLHYTGDIFKAYYCSELGWVKSVAENGALQNKQAVIK